MLSSTNDQSTKLEHQLYEVRRHWSPEVYRRRRRSAMALQRALVKVVLRPLPHTRPIPQTV